MSTLLRPKGRVLAETSDNSALPPSKKLKTAEPVLPSLQSPHESLGGLQVDCEASEELDEEVGRGAVDPNFGLLRRLPTELRLKIYKAAFDEISVPTRTDARISLATDERTLILPFGFVHPLLKINAAMYREVGDVFFRSIIYHCRFDMSKPSSSNAKVNCPAWKDGLTFMRRDEESAVIGILITPINVQKPDMSSLAELGSPFSTWKHMRAHTIFLPTIDALDNFASHHLNGHSNHTRIARPSRFVAVLPPPSEQIARWMLNWRSNEQDVTEGCIELITAAAARPWNSRLWHRTLLYSDLVYGYNTQPSVGALNRRWHRRSYLGWCAWRVDHSEYWL